jgi:hypothetical protein
MKNIEPTYVSFEQAKFLKEKGFGKWTGDIKTTDYCHAKYFHNKPSGYGLINWKETDILYISGYDNWVNEYPYCNIWTYAPEQWQIVEWLRVNHGIWISVQPNEPFTDDDWCMKIFKNNKLAISLEGYNSPQEAYSAAFDYILTNNLI